MNRWEERVEREWNLDRKAHEAYEDGFGEAEENANLYALSWGFKDAEDLKAWGIEAEQQRLLELEAEKSPDAHQKQKRE